MAADNTAKNNALRTQPGPGARTNAAPLAKLLLFVGGIILMFSVGTLLSPSEKESAISVCIHHSSNSVPDYHLNYLISSVHALLPYSVLFFIDSSERGVNETLVFNAPSARIIVSDDLTHFGRSPMHADVAQRPLRFEPGTIYVLRDDQGDAGLGPATLEEIVRRRLVDSEFLLHLNSDYQFLPSKTDLAGMERYLLSRPGVAIVAGDVIGNRLDDDPSWRAQLLGRPNAPSSSHRVAHSNKRQAGGPSQSNSNAMGSAAPHTTVAFGLNVRGGGSRLEAVEIGQWRRFIERDPPATGEPGATAATNSSHVEKRLRTILALGPDEPWDHDGCHPVGMAAGFWLGRTAVLRGLPPALTAVWETHEQSLWMSLYMRNYQRVNGKPAASSQGTEDPRNGAALVARFCPHHSVQRLPFAPPRRPSNFSIAALCASAVPDSIDRIQLPYYSVACKLGLVCHHNGRQVAAGDSSQSGSSSASLCMTAKTGPSRPALISCETTELIGESAPPPFARGAHKSATLAQYRGVPMVLKRTPSETKSADVAKFTHEVDEEWFFLQRLSANPFRPSPYLMTFYGGCLGESRYGERQAVLADGPFAMMRWLVASPRLGWASRLHMALSVVKGLRSLDKSGVLLCGLNADQIGFDATLNAKIVDLGSAVSRLSGRRVGEGSPCETDSDCVRVLRRAHDCPSEANGIPCPNIPHQDHGSRRRCLPQLPDSRCVMPPPGAAPTPPVKVGDAPGADALGGGRHFREKIIPPGRCLGYDGSAMLPSVVHTVIAPLLLPADARRIDMLKSVKNSSSVGEDNLVSWPMPRDNAGEFQSSLKASLEQMSHDDRAQRLSLGEARAALQSIGQRFDAHAAYQLELPSTRAVLQQALRSMRSNTERCKEKSKQTNAKC